MSDTSHAVAALVEAINVAEGGAVAAYTFDAGPNACIFTREAPFSAIGQNGRTGQLTEFPSNPDLGRSTSPSLRA